MELRELGTALYLDRPLGAFKAPGEPDQTILLSYIAFSRSIARQQLDLLGKDPELLLPDELAGFRHTLETLAVSGVSVADVPVTPRPGVATLADAAGTAKDFIFVRTISLRAHVFFISFKFEPLFERLGLKEGCVTQCLILGRPDHETGEIVVTIWQTGTLHKRMELSMDPRDGYVFKRDILGEGVERPRKGLRVRRIWEEEGGEWRERDLTGEQLFARPR